MGVLGVVRHEKSTFGSVRRPNVTVNADTVLVVAAVPVVGATLLVDGAVLAGATTGAGTASAAPIVANGLASKSWGGGRLSQARLETWPKSWPRAACGAR